MLAVGDRVPDARVWLAPGDEATLEELAADRPLLILFYFFDWSTT